jgi:hypothetical protein
MAQLPYPTPEENSGTSPADPAMTSRAAGSQRWLLVAGISVAVALLLLMVVLHLTGVLGPGEHG